MATSRKHSRCSITALILAFVLVLGALSGCKKKQPEPAEGESAPNDVASPADASTDPLAAATSLFREPRASLQKVIAAAKTWDASFKEWWGKIAPDFTLTDIEGNVHKLSSYRGKEVVVVFWTTWCPTCTLEIPHLRELRDKLSGENLAILSISNEPPALLKEFAAKQKINYTVLSHSGDLAAPFGEVQYIPSSFFIDPEGRFKLAARGLVPTGDAEAIVQAK
jgi:peroxiredoxin